METLIGTSADEQPDDTSPSDLELEMLMDFAYRQRFKEFYFIDPSVWNVLDILSKSTAAALKWDEFSLDESTKMLDTLVTFIYSHGGTEYQIATFSAYRSLYKHIRRRFSREQLLGFPRNKIFKTVEKEQN